MFAARTAIAVLLSMEPLARCGASTTFFIFSRGLSALDGLLLEDVERGPRDGPCPERLDERLLVDHAAPRRVDDVRGLLHRLELRVLMLFRVSGVRGTWTERKSLSRMTSSFGLNSMPWALSASSFRIAS